MTLVAALVVGSVALLMLLVDAVLVVAITIEAVVRSIRRLRARRALRLEPQLVVPPLEQIAADLRRINRTRSASSPNSLRWVGATRAYDLHLRHACTALGVEEHLADLTDIDRDFERMRVEDALVAAGMVLGEPNHMV